MTRLGADGDLDSRVNDLIQRGLSAYGAGDLHGAMSYWKHALALDPDSRQATDYVAYVKRHFNLVDEVPAGNSFAGAEVELEVPFGLIDVHPVTEIDYNALDSLEVEMQVVLPSEDDDEFAEQPTRIRAAGQVEDVDEGWSLEGTGEFEAPKMPVRPETPAPRLTYEMSQADVGELADVLEPEDDSAAEGDGLISEIASVTEGLLIAESGAIEMEAGAADDAVELEAEPPSPPPAVAPAKPSPRATSFGYKPTIKPHAATLRGLPADAARSGLPQKPTGFKGGRPKTQPPPPLTPAPGPEPVELELEAEPLELDLGPATPSPAPRAPSPIMIGDVELDVGDDSIGDLSRSTSPQTADVDAPPGLAEVGELTEPPGSLRRHPRVEGVREAEKESFKVDPLAQDLGPPPEVEATPPPELGPLELDLELGKAGTVPPPDPDVQISYRPPTGDFGNAGDLGIPMGIDGGGAPVGAADEDEVSITVEPAGGGLEEQLAELEAEMRTSGGSVEWRTHDSGLHERADREPIIPEDELPKRQPTVLPEDVDVAGQIAADVERNAQPGESPEDRVRRRIFGFIDRADVELGRERYSIAAVAADLAMSEEPDSAIAQKLIHERHGLLLEVFRRYLGSLEAVPAVAVPMHEIAFHELDHRTAFLLSRIDGIISFEDILDISGMPRLEALRYLCRLRLQGILEVR